MKMKEIIDAKRISGDLIAMAYSTVSDWPDEANDLLRYAGHIIEVAAAIAKVKLELENKE